MPKVLTAAALLLAFAAPSWAGTDLAKLYPATLDAVEEPLGHPYRTTPGDVHRLTSFRLAGPGGFVVETGPAILVVGHAGTSALFAVLLPDEGPGDLRFPETGEEKTPALWLRFHPARIGGLFPAETVAGPGPAAALLRAKRMADERMSSSIHAGGLPAVPAREVMVVDADVATGARRFFLIDERKPETRYYAVFANRVAPKPPAAPISREDALAVFDRTWAAFDKEYAMFGIRPDVDWQQCREVYRPVAEAAGTAWEAAAAIDLLLAELRDLHVRVSVGDATLPGFSRYRPPNVNVRVTYALAGATPGENGITAGRTEDGVGYIEIAALTGDGLPAAFDGALDAMKDAKGLILDLRRNGGGDERLGQAIAGRFVPEETVYSQSRVRAGPGRTDLSDPIPRSVVPRGPWRFDKPVIVLTGRATMSSAESFVLMLSRAPNVVTMGAPTAGSSGNPRRLELPCGIVVTVPRWLHLDPEGAPIDEVGVAPKVPVEAAPSRFRMDDPVIRRALEALR